MRRIFILGILLLYLNTGRAQVQLFEGQGIPQKGIVQPSKTAVSWAKRAKQGFNMRVWLSNQMEMGIQAWNDGGMLPPEPCTTGGLGLEYPVGSCIEHLFGAGPWIGAIIDGVRRVTEGYNGDVGDSEMYPERQDTLSDRIWLTSIYNAGEPNRKSYDDDGDGKIDEDELDGMDNDGDWNPQTDDLGADGLPDSLEVGCKGGYDPVTNPDPAFDNYDPGKFDYCRILGGSYPRKSDKKRYTQNNGIPDHGERHVDEDYGAISESDMYISSTDTFKSYPPPHDHMPMGVKVFLKSYAWEKGTSADAIVFLDYAFINISKTTWKDVYIGMFVDADLGPVNVPNYWVHNYSQYDLDTRTGFIHNPIDSGSTPLGLTLVSSSRPLDSLRPVFQWFDYSGPCSPCINDSGYYSWMSCEHWGYDTCIARNQSPDNPGDTRFLVSYGSFDSLQAGDTIKATFAFVSGATVREMLNNARRAKRIRESKGFLMPVVSVRDLGEGKTFTVSWDRMDRSPVGNVISYRVYYGTNPGQYMDSLTTDSLFVTFADTIPGIKYYAAVRAIDDAGNLSALSDEVSTIPAYPRGLKVFNHERVIELKWTANPETDLQGYNVYRRSTKDSLERKINLAVVSDAQYVDSTVWGDQMYYYRIKAVDRDANEGPPSDEVRGHLIAPSAPRNFAAGGGADYLHLGWSPNKEGDLVGYNIYRSMDSDSGFLKIIRVPVEKRDYLDTAIVLNTTYYYILEAVDSTDAVSTTPSVSGVTRIMNPGVFAQYFHQPDLSTAPDFYDWILREYTHEVSWMPIYGGPSPQTTTYIWIDEDSIKPLGSRSYYPTLVKSHLLGGGKLLIIGRRLPWNASGPGFEFLSEIFGIDYFTSSDTTFNFAGTNGAQGFPSLTLDTIKLSSTKGKLNEVDWFPNVPQSQVLYTYHSNPYDPFIEDQPVGLKARDTNYHAYYLSFPLYYLDSSSAKALITKILTDFGEVTAIPNPKSQIPNHFALYQCYPNPFNPATTIRFDIPTTSDVTLSVYDILGRKVVTLVNEHKPAGHYEVRWDASHLASGIYFYQIRAGNFIAAKKLLLMR